MNKRDDVIRKRVDAVDETILLVMEDSPKSLGNISTLARLNYHTCRQRLKKLLRYN